MGHRNVPAIDRNAGCASNPLSGHLPLDLSVAHHPRIMQFSSILPRRWGPVISSVSNTLTTSAKLAATAQHAHGTADATQSTACAVASTADGSTTPGGKYDFTVTWTAPGGRQACGHSHSATWLLDAKQAKEATEVLGKYCQRARIEPRRNSMAACDHNGPSIGEYPSKLGLSLINIHRSNYFREWMVQQFGEPVSLESHIYAAPSRLRE